MLLTKRRREFIETLVELFIKKGEPVHYVEVAEKMGISKWTAYDILKELEKLGFVKTEYYLKENKGQGRSAVVFSPTENAYLLVSDSAKKEWLSVRELLLKKLMEFNNIDHIEDILKELNNNKIKVPLTVCAYTLTVFLMAMRLFDDNLVENIKNIVTNTSPQISLTFFVGMVVGIFMNIKDRYTIIDKLMSILDVFHYNINKLSAYDLMLLNNFLNHSFSNIIVI